MALDTLSSLDLTLLSLHWVAIGNDAVAVLRGDGQLLPDTLAKILIDTAWDKISRLCTNRGYKCAYLYAKGNGKKPRLYKVDAVLSMSASDDESQPTSTNEGISAISTEIIFTTPEPELRITTLEQSPLPTYINAIRTQKKFYANPSALSAQGKPPEDFLDGNAYDLNDPDELDSRSMRISTGETLWNYEYEGWRWYFDTDAGRFRLKRMQLVSNFRLLRSFNGVPCWLGQVQQATELSRRQL
jgi:hypothetical protein